MRHINSRNKTIALLTLIAIQGPRTSNLIHMSRYNTNLICLSHWIGLAINFVWEFGRLHQKLNTTPIKTKSRTRKHIHPDKKVERRRRLNSQILESSRTRQGYMLALGSDTDSSQLKSSNHNGVFWLSVARTTPYA